MNEVFEVRRLTPEGLKKAQEIAEAFDQLLTRLETVCVTDGRDLALVRTKLQEACFFAKRALARLHSEVT